MLSSHKSTSERAEVPINDASNIPGHNAQVQSSINEFSDLASMAAAQSSSDVVNATAQSAADTAQPATMGVAFNQESSLLTNSGATSSPPLNPNDNLKRRKGSYSRISNILIDRITKVKSSDESASSNENVFAATANSSGPYILGLVKDPQFYFDPYNLDTLQCTEQCLKSFYNIKVSVTTLTQVVHEKTLKKSSYWKKAATSLPPLNEAITKAWGDLRGEIATIEDQFTSVVINEVLRSINHIGVYLHSIAVDESSPLLEKTTNKIKSIGESYKQDSSESANKVAKATTFLNEIARKQANHSLSNNEVRILKNHHVNVVKSFKKLLNRLEHIKNCLKNTIQECDENMKPAAPICAGFATAKGWDTKGEEQEFLLIAVSSAEDNPEIIKLFKQAIDGQTFTGSRNQPIKPIMPKIASKNYHQLVADIAKVVQPDAAPKKYKPNKKCVEKSITALAHKIFAQLNDKNSKLNPEQPAGFTITGMICLNLYGYPIIDKEIIIDSAQVTPPSLSKDVLNVAAESQKSDAKHYIVIEQSASIAQEASMEPETAAKAYFFEVLPACSDCGYNKPANQILHDHLVSLSPLGSPERFILSALNVSDSPAPPNDVVFSPEQANTLTEQPQESTAMTWSDVTLNEATKRDEPMATMMAQTTTGLLTQGLFKVNIAPYVDSSSHTPAAISDFTQTLNIGPN